MSELKGATIWARQTVESEIFYNKPDKWFKIWFFLISRASHKKTKKYDAGEIYLHYDWICDGTGATKDQVKKCISWLKKDDMIVTQRSTRGVWIKIPKYTHFQSLKTYKKKPKALEKHQRSTREAPRYNKNDKNDKNKEYTISYTLVEILKEIQKLKQPDGDYRYDNLFPAKSLAKYLREEYEEHQAKGTAKIEDYTERTYQEKRFAEILKKMDNFNRQNATSIKYIKNNWNKIINKLK